MSVTVEPFNALARIDEPVPSLEIYPDVRLELIDRSRQELLIINWVDYDSIFNAGGSFLTGGAAGHTSIIVPLVLPNGKSADSLLHVHALGSGVKYNRVSHTIARKDYAIVYRVQAGGDLSAVYDLLAGLVDKKYDWAQIAFIAAAVGAQRVVGTERFWQMFTGSRLDNWYEKETKGTYICSEVASIALREYGAPSSWPSARPVGFIDPNALVDIFDLQEVMRFKA
jgi:hypothetical protein